MKKSAKIAAFILCFVMVLSGIPVFAADANTKAKAIETFPDGSYAVKFDPETGKTAQELIEIFANDDAVKEYMALNGGTYEYAQKKLMWPENQRRTREGLPLIGYDGKLICFPTSLAEDESRAAKKNAIHDAMLAAQKNNDDEAYEAAENEMLALAGQSVNPKFLPFPQA